MLFLLTAYTRKFLPIRRATIKIIIIDCHTKQPMRIPTKLQRLSFTSWRQRGMRALAIIFAILIYVSREESYKFQGWFAILPFFWYFTKGSIHYTSLFAIFYSPTCSSVLGFHYLMENCPLILPSNILWTIYMYSFISFLPSQIKWYPIFPFQPFLRRPVY